MHKAGRVGLFATGERSHRGSERRVEPPGSPVKYASVPSNVYINIYSCRTRGGVPTSLPAIHFACKFACCAPPRRCRRHFYYYYKVHVRTPCVQAASRRAVRGPWFIRTISFIEKHLAVLLFFTVFRRPFAGSLSTLLANDALGRLAPVARSRCHVLRGSCLFLSLRKIGCNKELFDA